MEEADKVKPKTRRSRRKCYASDDPSHVCSVNHVRVPAHCRLKRNRKKKAIKELSEKLLPEMPKNTDYNPSEVAQRWKQDAVSQRIMQSL